MTSFPSPLSTLANLLFVCQQTHSSRFNIHSCAYFRSHSGSPFDEIYALLSRTYYFTSDKMSHPNTENYDFLRRGRSVRNDLGPSPGSISPRRKPLRHESHRSSRGTLSTATSNSQMSAATNITQPPSFSKKFVVVGDGGCGKTCLLISYSQGYFPEVSSPVHPKNRRANGLTEIRAHCLRKLHIPHHSPAHW